MSFYPGGAAQQGNRRRLQALVGGHGWGGTLRVGAGWARGDACRTPTVVGQTWQTRPRHRGGCRNQVPLRRAAKAN